MKTTYLIVCIINIAALMIALYSRNWLYILYDGTCACMSWTIYRLLEERDELPPVPSYIITTQDELDRMAANILCDLGREE